LEEKTQNKDPAQSPPQRQSIPKKEKQDKEGGTKGRRKKEDPTKVALKILVNMPEDGKFFFTYEEAGEIKEIHSWN